jgi:hypothetical protein
MRGKATRPVLGAMSATSRQRSALRCFSSEVDDGRGEEVSALPQSTTPSNYPNKDATAVEDFKAMLDVGYTGTGHHSEFLRSLVVAYCSLPSKALPLSVTIQFVEALSLAVRKLRNNLSIALRDKEVADATERCLNELMSHLGVFIDRDEVSEDQFLTILNLLKASKDLPVTDTQYLICHTSIPAYIDRHCDSFEVANNLPSVLYRFSEVLVILRGKQRDYVVAPHIFQTVHNRILKRMIENHNQYKITQLIAAVGSLSKNVAPKSSKTSPSFKDRKYVYTLIDITLRTLLDGSHQSEELFTDKVKYVTDLMKSISKFGGANDKLMARLHAKCGDNFDDVLGDRLNTLEDNSSYRTLYDLRHDIIDLLNSKGVSSVRRENLFAKMCTYITRYTPSHQLLLYKAGLMYNWGKTIHLARTSITKYDINLAASLLSLVLRYNPYRNERKLSRSSNKLLNTLISLVLPEVANIKVRDLVDIVGSLTEYYSTYGADIDFTAPPLKNTYAVILGKIGQLSCYDHVLLLSYLSSINLMEVDEGTTEYFELYRDLVQTVPSEQMTDDDIDLVLDCVSRYSQSRSQVISSGSNESPQEIVVPTDVYMYDVFLHLMDDLDKTVSASKRMDRKVARRFMSSIQESKRTLLANGYSKSMYNMENKSVRDMNVQRRGGNLEQRGFSDSIKVRRMERSASDDAVALVMESPDVYIAYERYGHYRRKSPRDEFQAQVGIALLERVYSRCSTGDNIRDLFFVVSRENGFCDVLERIDSHRSSLKPGQMANSINVVSMFATTVKKHGGSKKIWFAAQKYCANCFEYLEDKRVDLFTPSQLLLILDVCRSSEMKVLRKQSALRSIATSLAERDSLSREEKERAQLVFSDLKVTGMPRHIEHYFVQ